MPTAESGTPGDVPFFPTPSGAGALCCPDDREWDQTGLNISFYNPAQRVPSPPPLSCVAGWGITHCGPVWKPRWKAVRHETSQMLRRGLAGTGATALSTSWGPGDPTLCRGIPNELSALRLGMQGTKVCLAFGNNFPPAHCNEWSLLYLTRKP